MIGSTDELSMTETNPKDTFRVSILPDDIFHNTRLIGNTRTGRKKNFIKRINFFQRYFIIPVDFIVNTHLPDDVDEIKGE